MIIKCQKINHDKKSTLLFKGILNVWKNILIIETKTEQGTKSTYDMRCSWGVSWKIYIHLLDEKVRKLMSFFYHNPLKEFIFSRHSYVIFHPTLTLYTTTTIIVYYIKNSALLPSHFETKNKPKIVYWAKLVGTWQACYK